jgi:hypothetical protein
MEELVARIGRERGQPLDVACYFNDRRRTSSDGPGPVPTPEQLSAALPRSTFHWRRKQDRCFEHLFIHLENADAQDRIGITVAGDTGCLSPEEMDACVRGMERVAAAADLATPTLTTRPGAGPASSPGSGSTPIAPPAS